MRDSEAGLAGKFIDNEERSDYIWPEVREPVAGIGRSLPRPAPSHIHLRRSTAGSPGHKRPTAFAGVPLMLVSVCIRFRAQVLVQ